MIWSCTKIAVLSLSFATIGLRLQASTVQRDGKHSTPYLVQLYFVDKAIWFYVLQVLSCFVCCDQNLPYNGAIADRYLDDEFSIYVIRIHTSIVCCERSESGVNTFKERIHT